MTDDGAFRIVAARTTATAMAAIEAQAATGSDATDLAELLTCAVLYRETMAPNLRVQCIVRRAGGGGDRLVADAHPDGTVRGLVQPKFDKEHDHDDIHLHMMRSLPNGEVHRSVIAAPEPWNLSAAFMRYMHQSEQIVSMISIGAVLGATTNAVGGFVVQVLPEAHDIETALGKMTEKLEPWSDIAPWLADNGADVQKLVHTLFEDGPFTWLSESEVRFGCHCSEMRVLTTLASLGRDQLQEMVQDGAPIDMSCDYCGSEYMIESAQIQGLLASS